MEEAVIFVEEVKEAMNKDNEEGHEP